LCGCDKLRKYKDDYVITAVSSRPPYACTPRCPQPQRGGLAAERRGLRVGRGLKGVGRLRTSGVGVAGGGCGRTHSGYCCFCLQAHYCLRILNICDPRVTARDDDASNRWRHNHPHPAHTPAPRHVGPLPISTHAAEMARPCQTGAALPPEVLGFVVRARQVGAPGSV